MPRPVKWSRDVHLIREKASRSSTETWSRRDIEHLFGIGRASAQSLMKAIGEVQNVAGAHFVERPALLAFLGAMIAASSVDEAMRGRLDGAEAVPRPKPLRVFLPADLRHAMLPDLPPNITLELGRLEIRAKTAEAMLESLLALAMVMTNDLERLREVIETSPAHFDSDDGSLREAIHRWRLNTSEQKVAIG